MKKECRDEIYELIKSKLEKKLEEKKKDFGESGYKPFFEAIFSKKELFTGSIVQSIYTTFGMSIYEQIAVILAKHAGFEAKRQYTLKGEIDAATSSLISTHWNKLKTDLKNKVPVVPDKLKEIEMIKKSIKPGRPLVHGDSTVDVFIRKPDGTEYYFDITTVKNNLKSFEVLKLKMLTWIALRASTDKSVNAHSMIVIPYNPYHPEDYISSQWNSTIIDRKYDILVQEDFWNLVGDDENTFQDLLSIFRQVGNEMKEDIEDFFNQKF